jgi:hypothetical protein
VPEPDVPAPVAGLLVGFFLLGAGFLVVPVVPDGDGDAVVVGLVVCAWTSDGTLATGMASAMPKMRETDIDLTSLLILTGHSSSRFE